MKFVIKIYILSMLSTSFLFSQLIEIDKTYSLSVEGIDLQRAYINSDNMMIAAEQLFSPLQVYFFSIDDNFTIPQVAVVTGHKTWKELQRYERMRASQIVDKFIKLES